MALTSRENILRISLHCLTLWGLKSAGIPHHVDSYYYLHSAGPINGGPENLGLWDSAYGVLFVVPYDGCTQGASNADGRSCLGAEAWRQLSAAD
ncbi:hypothetical protein PAAG_12141 [Paracoccidioides lutzii Pb01]|uniref:Uncharacterized protein n=1 Tax=Paracoccidioides lutzii (strain ATCC MYA-826 / Pb01) TaxID=502779 RepID=A0A0A2V099_PARBA|nr:hypothetical protein PAAG_12141 [Paracoccidioides lutzii Pb01]KGQ01196.1 hypothetical protein PAAG_12141 [Paracoccidioides lutzii Pb01]